MKDWLGAEIGTWSDLALRSLVIVDGDNGVGKSTYVAPRIAQVVAGNVISVDGYLAGNSAPYLEQIDYQRLRAAILAGAPKVIVEGICMLKVMAGLSLPHDYHVFVKRLQMGHWENEMWLAKGSREPKSSTTKGLIAYYKECEPFQVCNRCVEVDPLDFFSV